jgi:hypothetical protein
MSVSATLAPTCTHRVCPVQFLCQLTIRDYGNRYFLLLSSLHLVHSYPLLFMPFPASCHPFISGKANYRIAASHIVVVKGVAPGRCIMRRPYLGLRLANWLCQRTLTVCYSCSVLCASTPSLPFLHIGLHFPSCYMCIYIDNIRCFWVNCFRTETSDWDQSR